MDFSSSVNDRGQEDAQTIIQALRDRPKFATLCVYSLNCLGKLASNRNNLDYMMSLNASSVILDTMERHNTSPRIIKEGCDPLIKACRYPEYAKSIGKEGGIEFCLRQLNRSTDSGSNAHVVRLLEALCDGCPDNIQLMKESGGVDVLMKSLKDAHLRKDENLIASLSNVVEKMTRSPKICAEMTDDHFDTIVKSLRDHPNNPAIVYNALKIIRNLAQNDKKIANKLKALGVVDLISAGMAANPTHQGIREVGTFDLNLLSESGDLVKALKKLDSRDKIELKNSIAMVGNLSLIGDNAKTVTKEGGLQKLLKIIKPLVEKLDKMPDDKKKILSSAVQAAAKISSKDEIVDTFVKHKGLEMLNTFIAHPDTKNDNLVAALIATRDLCSSNSGYNYVVNHPKIISDAVKKVDDCLTDDKVDVAACLLYQTLASKDSGFALIKKLGTIAQVCNMVNDHIHVDKVVSPGLDTLIKFSEHTGEIAESDLKLMTNTALNVLKECAEKPEHCKKALKLLKKMAENSEFVRNLLRDYECASILSNFAKDLDDEELIAMHEDLKSIIRGGGVGQKKIEKPTVVDSLKELNTKSHQLEPNKDNSAIFSNMYQHSENLAELMQSSEGRQAFVDADGLKILPDIIEKINQCPQSEVSDHILENLNSILAHFAKDIDTAYLMATDGSFDTVLSLYKVESSDTIQSSIKNVTGNLEGSKKDLLGRMNDHLTRGGNVLDLIKMYEQLAQMSDVQNRMPKNLDYGMTNFMKNAGDFSIGTIVSHGPDDNKDLFYSAVTMLDVLNKNADFREYFSTQHVDGLCNLVRNNPDDSEMCAIVFDVLAEYSNYDACSGQISDLRNWYMNRSLETDLNARKQYFLDTCYETMDDKEKSKEFGQALQNLVYCYDDKNDLVNINDPYTPIDEEIAMYAMYLQENDNISAEHKKLAANIFHQMAKSPALENMLYKKDFIGQMCFMVKKNPTYASESYIFMALTPFMRKAGHQDAVVIQSSMNDLLLSSLGKTEEERNALLDTLLSQLSDTDGNSHLDSYCLSTILRMLDAQKTPEGKAKCVHLLKSIAKASDVNGHAICSGIALKKVVDYLKQYNKNKEYAGATAHFTRVLAEYDTSIPKLEEEKVDELMKDLMFQYNNTMEIFHNAQRTIDLMNLVRLKLTPEELAKWKARARSKQLMTEFCRGLGCMIAYYLTKAEREVRTGDSQSDIHNEVRRILNEFGTSMDDAIESNAPTGMLTSLATAQLLRGYLMTYTFLVEKDISARSFQNVPKTIEETLVGICGFNQMQDWSNTDYENINLCVRGGIGHQAVRAMLDAGLVPQKCHEIDPVTNDPVGREYSLGDLIRQAKMDTNERDTLKIFNLILAWIKFNWEHVVVTVSLLVNHKKDGTYKESAQNDAAFLSMRLGLDQDQPKEINKEHYYFMKPHETYRPVGEIVRKPDQKGGLLITVEKSGEELRKKRREIQDTIDLSSNVLNGDEREELDFFMEFSAKSQECKNWSKKFLKAKPDIINIKFAQQNDGDLYLSWNKPGDSNEKCFNMKEVEAVTSGKTSKTFQKISDSKLPATSCFVVEAAGDRDLNLQLNSKKDRDIQVRGLNLVLCTVAGRKPSEMIW